MENSLIKFMEHKKAVFCYGAGEWAFWVTLFLKIYHLDIHGYIVTKKEEQEYLEQKVYHVEEIKFNENNNVIVAVSGRYHEEIINSLDKANKNLNVYLIKERELREIVQYLTSMKYEEILRLLDGKISEETCHVLLKMQIENNKNNLTKLRDIWNNHSKFTYQTEFNLLKDKYSLFPSYTQTKLSFQGKEIIVPDVSSFLFIYEEILLNGIYEFKAEERELVIFDIGANIGIASFYFSKTYPNAQIIAFEADKKIFDALQYNMDVLECKNVTAINKAVWNKNEILSFYSEGADGGRIESSPMDNKNMIQVEAVDVADLLKEYTTIDFLKMDIEGAETTVLQRAERYLGKVQNIFVEYHSKVNEKQTLNTVIDILSKCGFRLYLHTMYVDKQPYMKQKSYNEFDLLINIFGIREEA